MSSRSYLVKVTLISYLSIQRCLDCILCKLQMKILWSTLTVKLLPDTTVAAAFFLSRLWIVK